MPQTLQEVARGQIQKWIHSTGITQTELSERIGRNQAWMSRYLKGDFDADLDTLQKMAQVFGHSLAQMFQVPTNPEEAALVTAYRALPLDARQIALNLLQHWSRGPRKPRAPRRSNK